MAIPVDLIVAALDLKLVQLLRGAMRAADIASGRGQAATPLGPAPDPEPQRRFHYTPEPVIEPRRHFHPSPIYERPLVIHLRPRFVEPPPIPLPAPMEPESPHKPKSPFVPPWKLLPWENAPQTIQVIKVVKRTPDIVRKGTLLDCFI